MSLNYSALKQQSTNHGIKNLPQGSTHQSRINNTKISNTGQQTKLPHVKGAVSPLDRKEKDLLINAGLGAMHGLGTGSVVTN